MFEENNGRIKLGLLYLDLQNNLAFVSPKLLLKALS